MLELLGYAALATVYGVLLWVLCGVVGLASRKRSGLCALCKEAPATEVVDIRGEYGRVRSPVCGACAEAVREFVFGDRRLS